MRDKYPKVELLIHELSNNLLTLYCLYLKTEIYISKRRIARYALLVFNNLINIWYEHFEETGYNVLSPRYF